MILFSGDFFPNWFQIVHTSLKFTVQMRLSIWSNLSCVLWGSTEVNSFFYRSLKADRYSTMWQKPMPNCPLDGVSGESYNLAISAKQIHHVQRINYLLRSQTILFNHLQNLIILFHWVLHICLFHQLSRKYTKNRRKNQKSLSHMNL